MNEISFLPGEGRLFDHEDLAREVLRHALGKWFDKALFDLHAIRAMRAIVRELIDLPEESFFEACEEAPKLLDPLIRAPFSSLKEVNRRECIRLCLEYAGITEWNGVDLLGAQAWNDLQARTDELCTYTEVSTVETPPLRSDLKLAERAERSGVASPSAWPQDVIADLLIQLLEGNSFSHYEFDRVVKAVGHYRNAVKAVPLPATDAFLYAGMCSLDHVRFHDMTGKVRNGLPGAILQALHLDDDSSPSIIGEAAWRKVDSFYRAWAARPWKSSPEANDGGQGNVWRTVVLVGLMAGALVTVGTAAVFLRHRSPTQLQIQGRSAPSASPTGKGGQFS